MAVSMRSAAVSTRAVKASQPRSVVCHGVKENVSMSLAAVAAAALLVQPANAGVILAKPEIKKVFQDDAPASALVERPFRLPGSSSAPATKAAPAKAAPKKEEFSTQGGLDPRSVALPGALVLIAGMGAAASKVDAGFSSWLNESGALVRNSTAFAGFEEQIKSNPNYIDGGSFGPAAGTQAVKGTQKTKKGTQKGGK